MERQTFSTHNITYYKEEGNCVVRGGAGSQIEQVIMVNIKKEEEIDIERNGKLL